MQEGGVAMVKQQAGEKKAGPLRPPEEALRCPRCDSLNTKFCYYNNYSLAQPRHFCKTCRRYWTKGGALRNVPIGGGCRKNKRSGNKASSSSSSHRSLSEEEGKKYHGGGGGTSCGGGITSPISSVISPPETLVSSHTLQLLHGLPSSASLDFQAGCSPFSRLPPAVAGHFLSFSPSSGSAAGVNSSGYGYPLSGAVRNGDGTGFCGYSSSGFGEMGCQQNIHGSIAASIESLSTMNADLHWKLQQQRLAMLLGGGDHKGTSMDMGVSAGEFQQGFDQQQPQICLQIPNNVKTDGVRSFSSNRRGSAQDYCEPREATGEWVLENSWPDLHQYSSLP